MPKRISKKLKDPNQIAAAVVAVSTEESTELERSFVSQVMAEMGRKGGKIGGKRRLETLSPEKRRKIASNAAKTRWAKRKTQ